MLKNIARFFTLWLIMGMVYFSMEGIWRGWTHGAMIAIGGLCGVLIGLLDENQRWYKLRVWQECIIGAFIILTIEFISGYILNVKLQFNIWDYSDKKFNLMGQICINTAILWFFLVPFAIWIDDWLRWKLYGSKEPYNVIEIYKELFTGK